MVRLPNLVNGVRRKFSEARSFVQNPSAFFYRRARRSAQTWYEGASVGEQSRQGQNNKKQSGQSAYSQGKDSWGRSPRHNHSVSSDLITWEKSVRATSQATLTKPSAKLQDGETLQGGWWGRYLVGACLQDQDWLRLYEGIQENGDEPVWIYHYTLSDADYNSDEIAERYQAFKQLINLNLKFGNDADFRLIRLKDVIVSRESGCYLVTKPITGGITLQAHLQTRSYPFSNYEIYQVLNQVLQSLQYLYSTYRVRWPHDHSERRLCHGNLTLDNLIVRWVNQPNWGNEQAFFIYLSRFALWEHLFDPNCRSSVINGAIVGSVDDLGSVADDLQCLGEICTELLTWNQQLLDPQVSRTITGAEPVVISDQQLESYLARLQAKPGVEPFKGFDVALAQLRQLAQKIEVKPKKQDEARPPLSVLLGQQTQKYRWLKLSLLTLGISAIALSITYWLASLHLFGVKPIASTNTQTCTENCRLNDIAGWPTRKVIYTIEPYSSWTSAIAQSVTSSTQSNVNSLETTLAARSPRLSNLAIKGIPAETKRREIFRQLSAGELDFALMELGQDLPAELTAQIVAYDGIAIFVAFSDAGRSRNIPRLLDGKIELQTLQKLVVEQRTQLADYPAQLHQPSNELTVNNFKTLLTQVTDTQTQQFQGPTNSREPEPGANPNLRNDVYEQILGRFEAQEDDVIRIGFDRFSRMFGQCAVYPLSLQIDDAVVHPVVESNGQPITENTDLCGDKGGYWFNSLAFQHSGDREQAESQYPFTYPLAVIHPKCSTSSPQLDCQAGQSLAKMLKTIEGQYLLGQMNLIPLVSIDDINSKLWGNNGKE